VDDGVLDLLHGGREVGDPVAGVTVQHGHHDIRKELGQVLVIPRGLEKSVVHPREVI